MPEDAAIARGIDPLFKLRLSGDIACTDDGLYLFSRRAQEFFHSKELDGLEFVTIPKEDRYVLAFPRVFAKLEQPQEMLRYDSACPICGRCRWVGIGYERMSFSSLPDVRTVFNPDVWLEDAFARTTTLICTEEVAGVFRAAKRAKQLQKFFIHELAPAPRLNCSYCSGSGKCYCVRTNQTSTTCPRCNGSGNCHVCGGTGKK